MKTPLGATFIPRATKDRYGVIKLGSTMKVDDQGVVDMDAASNDINSFLGTLSIPKGGTGQTASVAAFDALAPTVGKGQIIVRGDTVNTNLFPGSNGQFLRANSATVTGLEWADIFQEGTTASNVGNAGQGLFDAKVVNDLQFRNLAAFSSKIAVALDAPNKNVTVDVVEANLTLNNIGGTLGVSKGGTNAASFTTSELIRMNVAGTALESSGKVAPTGAIVGTTDSQTLINKTLDDATTAFADNGDPSKKMQFEVSGVSASTTRTMTVPNKNGTLALLDDTPTVFQNQNKKPNAKIWAASATTANGVATFNPTDDNTVNGNAIFTNVYSITATAVSNTATATAVPLASIKLLSADKKTLTINSVKGVVSIALGATMEFSADGTTVNVVIIGD